MGGDFGAPIMGNTAAEAAAPGTPLPSNDVQELIDPNDPRLTSESLDVNTEGDAYVMPPPPPDHIYRAKLKLVQVEDAQQQKHDFLPKLGKKAPRLPYYFTAIEARIIDPSGKYDNIPVWDRWVGTFVGRDGSTKVQTILSKLLKPDGQPYLTKGLRTTHLDWITMFVKALNTEPEIGIETQWEWSCQGCGEEAKAKGVDYPKSVIGMTKFPTDPTKSKPGALVFIPEMKCAVNAAHGYSTARPTISRFLALSELK